VDQILVAVVLFVSEPCIDPTIVRLEPLVVHDESLDFQVLQVLL
jgi:hypothetical protein